MQKYINSVSILTSGAAAPGASIQVLNYPALTIAIIYSDNVGTVTNNPLTADNFGNFGFYAANGRYQLIISGSTIVTQYVADILLQDLQDSKDVLNGVPGLTGYNIDMKNQAGSFTSYLTNTNTASRSYTLPDASGTVALINNLGSRDRTINSGFRVSQYNSNASVTVTAAVALAYNVDRFWSACTGANVTGQRVTGAGQDQYYWQFTGAAAVTGIQFGQRYETANTYDLNNKTCTFAVELANSLLTTVTWTAYYANTTDTFGTLGAPTKTQIATGTFTVTSAMATYSTQISVPAAATTGIEVILSVGAQTSGTFGIGRWHLAQEATFSGFDFTRDFQSESGRCRLYFKTSYNPGVAVGAASQLNTGESQQIAIGAADFYLYRMSAVQFGTPMRVTPTVNLYNPSTGLQGSFWNYSTGATSGNSAVGAVAVNGFGVYSSNNALVASQAYGTHWTASSEL